MRSKLTTSGKREREGELLIANSMKIDAHQKLKGGNVEAYAR